MPRRPFAAAGAAAMLLALVACQPSTSSNATQTPDSSSPSSYPTPTVSTPSLSTPAGDPTSTTARSTAAPGATATGSPSGNGTSSGTQAVGIPTSLYAVAGVVDGDTIKVMVNGAKTTIRLIGVDTPELHKPNTPVQCYAQKAASYMQHLVQSKSVGLEADPSQGDVDKYGRSLRYVLLPDGRNVAQLMIAGGYGREYTYDLPYRYQSAFQAAQTTARNQHLGLWSACPYFGAPVAGSTPTATSSPTSAPAGQGQCVIKGNINRKGEKIYHVPGQRSYDATKITPAKGERWFCTEAEAVNAGWRKAKA